MKNNRILTVITICVLCVSSTKAALQLNWGDGTLQCTRDISGFDAHDIVTIDSLAASKGATWTGNPPDVGSDGNETFALQTTDVHRISFGNSDKTPASSDIQFNGAVITPVPEPINCALAFFGLVFAGGGVGRFYLGRLRRA